MGRHPVSDPAARVAATARFGAARRLAGAPAGHRLARLHGNGFLLRASAPAPLAQDDAEAALDRLHLELARCAREADHRLLNDLVGEPSCEGIGHWALARLGRGAARTQLQILAGPAEGVVLCDGDPVAWRRFRFEAAHRLPHVPQGHKCGRMHGHGFEVEVQVRLQPGAEVAAFDAIDAAWQPLGARLDGGCLNDIEGLANPTSEVLCRWLHGRLAERLADLGAVAVLETRSSGARFDGRDFRIWKDFSLDSAVAARSGRGPGVLGHTYLLRLHLVAPLDERLGWVIDFGDVKERFGPVFDELDHRPLHEHAGLAAGGLVHLARWVRRESGARLGELGGIDLFETPERGIRLGREGAGDPFPCDGPWSASS